TMGNALLCLLCLLGSGLVLPGSPEPAPGLRTGTGLSLPGHGREETELVRGWGRGTAGFWGDFGCEPREPCAVRRGARFGKLCSCPRGSACDLLSLRCS
ncbi:CART protein, partial [Paradoxornis webbianus]|nr:CART protein [Sinosuthora webbiana]